MVVDGAEGKRYHTGADYGLITPPVFSPDGRRVAYRVLSREQGETYEYVVVNGAEVDKQSAGFRPSEGAVVFSPDSRRVAHVSRHGDAWRIVVNGVAGKNYLQVGTPVFSPDSQRVAYTATPKFRQYIVVVDGKEGGCVRRHRFWYAVDARRLRATHVQSR